MLLSIVYPSQKCSKFTCTCRAFCCSFIGYLPCRNNSLLLAKHRQRHQIEMEMMKSSNTHLLHINIQTQPWVSKMCINHTNSSNVVCNILRTCLQCVISSTLGGNIYHIIRNFGYIMKRTKFLCVYIYSTHIFSVVCHILHNRLKYIWRNKKNWKQNRKSELSTEI